MSMYIELAANDGHRFEAYVAEPERPAAASILVIQEIFGVNAHIRQVADRFATFGFRAIAPALFDRAHKRVELDYDEAGVAKGREYATAIGFDNMLRDVAATADHARTRGAVGAVGYCWGGTVAFLCSTRLSLPAVSYYGGRTVPFLHERPSVALLMHFGDKDPLIPMEDVEKTRRALPEAQIHVYSAGHGFNCDARKDYDQASADLALKRTLAFFGKYLAPGN